VGCLLLFVGVFWVASRQAASLAILDSGRSYQDGPAPPSQISAAMNRSQRRLLSPPQQKTAADTAQHRDVVVGAPRFGKRTAGGAKNDVGIEAIHANDYETRNDNHSRNTDQPTRQTIAKDDTVRSERVYAKKFDLSASCTTKMTTSPIPDRHEIITKRYSNSSASQYSNSQTVPSKIDNNNPMMEAPTIPSLLSVDTEPDFSDYQEIMETDLYQRFEEAFSITIKNNPGILPGTSTLTNVKKALYDVQTAKAQREYEMKRKLKDVMKEKDQLEAQLKKEMGAFAWRKNELTKELETVTAERNIQQDSLNKQIDAIKAMKREIAAKTPDVAKEKEDLSRHLNYLSKSRKELEKALENESMLVEQDRNALQNVLAERKKLQQQKEDNKALEQRIERMTEAAQKEKLTLQAEVAELKRFEEHIAKVRTENEEVRKALEQERRQLKETAETLQSKKLMLVESLKELQIQFQEEIEELEDKVKKSKMIHEEEMESIIKSRVMTYLRGEKVLTSPRESPLDIEFIVRERVEAELKKKSVDTERVQAELKRLRMKEEMLESERVETETRRRNAERVEIEERKMKKAEVDLAMNCSNGKSNRRTNRTPIQQSPRDEDESEDIRGEIRRLRMEMKMIQQQPVARMTAGGRTISSAYSNEEMSSAYSNDDEVVDKWDRTSLSPTRSPSTRYLTPGDSRTSTYHSLVDERRDDFQRSIRGANSLSPPRPSQTSFVRKPSNMKKEQRRRDVVFEEDVISGRRHGRESNYYT